MAGNVSTGTKKVPSFPSFFLPPQAWFNLLLSEWLDIRSVATLDSAMTTHKYRSQFLQFLRDMRSKSVAANKSYDRHRVPYLVYLSRRQIHVKEIYFLEMGGLCNCVVNALCFPSLEKFLSRDIDDAGVLAIVRNSPLLKEIVLDGGRSNRELLLTDVALHAIAQHCPLLEEIIIGRNPPGKHPFITSDALVNLFQRCPKLKSVNLEQFVMYGFDDADFVRMQEFGALFTHFDFSFGPSVTVNAIVDFAATCSNVTFASSTNWVECDKVLLNVAQSSDRLKQLQLFANFSQSQSRTSDALRELARNCPVLEDITLYHCEYLNDTTLELLGKIGSLTKLMIQVSDPPSLPTTNIYPLSNVVDCICMIQGYDGQDEFTYSSFASGFQNLQCLHLSGDGGNYCPSPAFFNVLMQAPYRLPCLTEIWIFTDVPLQVDDVTVATALARCLPNLKEANIVLAQCRLNDAALAILSTGCPKLQSLSLGCSPPLTIEVLNHLATTCTELNDIAIWTEHDEDDDDDEEEEEDDDDWGIPEDELDTFQKQFPRINMRRI